MGYKRMLKAEKSRQTEDSTMDPLRGQVDRFEVDFEVEGRWIGK